MRFRIGDKKKHFSILLLITFAIITAIYLNYNQELIYRLNQISLWFVILLILLRISLLFINGLFLKTFTTKLKIQLTPIEWIGLPIVTSMGNYIFPFSAGMAFRATYLNKQYQLPYAQFVMLLIANYVLNFWVIGCIGFIISFSFITIEPFDRFISLLFVLITFGTSIIFLLPVTTLSSPHWLLTNINTAIQGWLIIKTDFRLLAWLIVYTLLQIFFNGLSVWVSFTALDSPVTFTASLLIGMLTIFSLLINVTPGNLGIQESITSFSSLLLGSSIGYGLLVALIIRATNMLVALGLGPIFSLILTKKLTHTLHKKAN